jgi:DNA-binding transcriptional regulator YiaG
MKGTDVQRLRRKLGLTQAALAARLGVHKLTVSRWECDRVRITEPTAHLLRLLATVPTTPKGGRRR